jgi:BarA-like signal transduction histidine kinase
MELLLQCDKVTAKLKEVLIDLYYGEQLNLYLWDNYSFIPCPEMIRSRVLQHKWFMLQRMTLDCHCSREMFDTHILSQENLDNCLKKIVNDIDLLQNLMATGTHPQKSFEVVLKDMNEYLDMIAKYDHEAHDHYWTGYTSSGYCLHGMIKNHQKMFGHEPSYCVINSRRRFLRESGIRDTKLGELLFACDLAALKIKHELIQINCDLERYWTKSPISISDLEAASLKTKWEIFRRLIIDCPCSNNVFDIDITSQKSLNECIKKIFDDLNQLRVALLSCISTINQSHEEYLEDVLAELKEFLQIIELYEYWARDQDHFCRINSKKHCLYGFIRHHLKLFGIELQSPVDDQMNIQLRRLNINN